MGRGRWVARGLEPREQAVAGHAESKEGQITVAFYSPHHRQLCSSWGAGCSQLHSASPASPRSSTTHSATAS